MQHGALHRWQLKVEIYARKGVEFDRTTSLIGRSAQRAVSPLVEALADHLLAGHKLHADETPVPMLCSTRGTTKQGRLRRPRRQWRHQPYRNWPYRQTEGLDLACPRLRPRARKSI
jgi:hypothetical protein